MGKMQGTLAGRCALVTGASRGVGAAAALELARQGASVALIARSRTDLDRAVSAIRKLGFHAAGFSCDVTDQAALSITIVKTISLLGPIDILINNAATLSPLGPTVATDLSSWRHLLDLNLLAPLQCTLACLPGMRSRGYGRIVNVSSGAAGGAGMSHGSAYSVSKSALEMLTRNLAAELDGAGVTVNAIRPGRVDTQMQAELRSLSTEQVSQQLARKHRQWQVEGQLLDASVPARAILEIVENDGNGQVVSVYGP